MIDKPRIVSEKTIQTISGIDRQFILRYLCDTIITDSITALYIDRTHKVGERSADMRDKKKKEKGIGRGNER